MGQGFCQLLTAGFCEDFPFHSLPRTSCEFAKQKIKFFLSPLCGLIQAISQNAKNERKKAANLFRLTARCAAVVGGGYLIVDNKRGR
jgi:hypothetical protein